MKIVYVVTSGSYSGYGIDSIFDSKELAQAYIDSFKKERYNEFNGIEEWELNPYESDLKAGRNAYFLRMDKDGNIKDLSHSDSTYGHRGGSSISFVHTKDWMNVYCFANNTIHAIKIANEKRIQILALNKWGEDNPLG